MADITKVIVIDVEDNASQDLTTIDKQLKSIDNTTQDLTDTQKKNTQGVLENGGAMGLLNDLTGGYAMMVKDAVEASSLFSKEGKIATAVQAGYATVVGASTGAMKAFRLALAATGIGLIVVALGLLVANFDKVVKYVQMGIDKFKGMGEGAKLLVSVLFPIVGVVRLITAALEEMGVIDDDATKKAKKNAEERIKALDKDKVSIEDKYNTEIRLAKAAGKDTVELEKQKRAAILQTLAALNDAERARIQSGEATQDEIKRWNERQKEIKKVVEDGKVAILEQERDREAKSKEIADKAAESRKARQDKADADEAKRQADIKKLNEGYVKQLQDLDAKTDEEKLALDRKRAEAELNSLKATSSEKLALKALYDRKEEDLLKTKEYAAFIVEPAMENIGIVLPDDGYLQGVRDLTKKYGTVLIFDEVKTGITSSYNGATGYFGVIPDMVCLAKSIGGGLPLGAFGGSKELMDNISNGKVQHLGTYNGNPLVMAAAKAVLKDICTKDAIEEATRKNRSMLDRIDAIIAQYDLPAHTVGLGAKGCITWSRERVRNYRDYKATDFELAYAQWVWGINRGILLPPGLDEQWLVGIQTTDQDCDQLVEVFKTFVEELVS